MMKVLIWRGNPVGVYGKEHLRDLLRVWVDRQNRLCIEETAPDLLDFAVAVHTELKQRISDPRGPLFMRLTGESREKEVNGKIVFGGSVTRQEKAMPGDDNFLEVLRSDRRLVENRQGKGIAGYEIDSGASRIVEEDIDE